jgi:hypothetical protein
LTAANAQFTPLSSGSRALSFLAENKSFDDWFEESICQFEFSILSEFPQYRSTEALPLATYARPPDPGMT